jgi:hypothetical protein
VDRAQAANHLSQVLQAVANPQQFPEVHAQAVLKHLWVYIDQRADKLLTFIQVLLLQLLEQPRPLLLGTGLAHHPMAVLRRLLVGRRRMSPVGV